MDRLPKVVVWDLDGTLWTPEMYQLAGGAPFKAMGEALHDKMGQAVTIMADARTILRSYHGAVQFAIASTCDHPKWAEECLQKFWAWEGMALTQVFAPQAIEIYWAETKREHFAAIARKLKCDYSDMLFLDNERRNVQAVGSLGVTCVLTPSGGVTEAAFAEALRLWRNAK